MITPGCSSMAGKQEFAAHVGALLWKVDMAVSSGMTGTLCTGQAAQRNREKMRNVEPVLLEEMNL